jgi:hypothetical protein
MSVKQVFIAVCTIHNLRLPHATSEDHIECQVEFSEYFDAYIMKMD